MSQKRLFILALVFIILVPVAVLIGVNLGSGDPEFTLANFRALQEQVEALESELEESVPQSDLSAMQAERDALQQTLDGLDSPDTLYYQAWSSRLGRTVNAAVGFQVPGSQTVITVPYNTALTDSAFDLLKQAFGDQLGYTQFSFGPFVSQIGSLNTQYGNFIEMSRNGTVMEQGIGDVAFNDKDVFSFALRWWNDDALAVTTLLDAYFDNEMDAALAAHNFYAAAALRLRGESRPLPSALAGENTLSSRVSQVLYLRGLGLDETVQLQALYPLLSSASLSPNSLFLDALAFSVVVDRFESRHVVDFNNQSRIVNYMDAFNSSVTQLDVSEATFDHLAMLIVNYHNEWDLDDVLARFDELLDAQENAASLALAVMALVVRDIDPAQHDYQDTNVLEALLNYHLGDGLFAWQKDDTQADLAFSTPQSILALVMLENYWNDRPVAPFVSQP